MDHWATEVKRMAEQTQELHRIKPVKFEGVKIHLLHKYVDDCLTVLGPLKLGVRWDPITKCMVWDKEDEDMDIANKVSVEKNTMEQFTNMASNIISCLKLMYDAPSCNPRGTMPVLDTEMWVGQEERELGIPDQILDQKLQHGRVKTGKLRQVLLYNFYKKPMANRAPNLASSAAPEGQKIVRNVSDA